MTHNPVPATLRDIAGLTRTPAPLAESTLLVIDAQIAYSAQGALPLPDIARASARLAELLAHARRQGVPVVHVAHIAGPGSPFDPAVGGRPLACAQPLPGEIVVPKSLPNAFAGTTLGEHLEELDRPLVICGFMTHMCVSSTARAALDLGWETSVVSDATASRSLPSSVSETPISATVIHEAALAALADRFSVVAPTSAFVQPDRTIDVPIRSEVG